MPNLPCHSVRLGILLALGLAGLALGGCGRGPFRVAGTTAPQAVNAGASGVPAPTLTTPPVPHAGLRWPSLQALPVVPASAATAAVPRSVPVGLVVCEPVTASTDAEGGRFGDGCGRWLHLMAAGQPELGRTPVWEGLGRAQQQLGRTDLRLALPDAQELARILGATHAAVGRLSGTAAHGALTYQLYRVPEGKAIGAPLTVAGTPEQILARLPGLARALAARAGVPSPRVPRALAASPADVRFLGGLPLVPGAAIPDADAERLCGLAPREPLAALFYLKCARPQGETERLKTARLLLAQMPENPLAWATVGWTDAHALRPARAGLARNSRRFPQNYLFALCDVWLSREVSDQKAEWAAAERVTRDAPRNPAAWLTLAYTLSDIAQDVRKSRLARHISPAEWAYLNRVYPEWLAATARAVALDPQFGVAWQRMASAATFVGDNRRADAAFWKALRLDPDHVDVLGWGLEMYQPKWGGDPATLDKVADLAAAQHYESADQIATIADSLEAAGFHDKAQAVTAAFTAQCLAAVRHDPNSPQARWELAAALRQGKDLDGSIREYQAAIGLRPDGAALRYDLGMAYDDRPRTRLAVGAYREALRLDPAMRDVHVKLGYDLKHLHDFPAAARELELAVRENPRDPEIFYALGELYSMQNQWKKAVAPLEAAIRLSPYDLEAYRDLVLALDEDKQYDRGIAVSLAAKVYGEAAKDPSTEYLNTMSDNLADLYLRKRNYAGAAEESQAALGRDDNDVVAHENLGEALIGQGHKAEAQAEWRRVLELDHGDMAQAARKMLAKYP